VGFADLRQGGADIGQDRPARVIGKAYRRPDGDEPAAGTPRPGAAPALGLAELQLLAHDPEKWIPVFRKDHAQKKS
jgi:hypothetical protein